MTIYHKITYGPGHRIAPVLASLGHQHNGKLVTLEISEEDPLWPAMADAASVHGPLHSVRTEFSKREFESAEYLEMTPSWHQGYPQPEQHFDFVRVAYDSSGYCDACGIKGNQIAPFRMSGEPGWGKNSILQLNWVFDEYFSKPETWSDIFEPLNIGFQPVIRHRDGTQLESVVQLDVSDRSDVNVSGLNSETCPSCGRVKYNWVTRGFSPSPVNPPIGVHAFKSSEWFGSDHSGNHMVFVSAKLYDDIVKSGIRGAAFRPCGI